MKKVIIAIIVVLLFVAILIGGGLFFYLKTDFIQSDKKMFFKYMSELPEFFEDKNLKQYSEKIKNTPYTSEGTIKVNAEFVDESNKSLEPYLKNCSINLKGSSKYGFILSYNSFFIILKIILCKENWKYF